MYSLLLIAACTAPPADNPDPASTPNPTDDPSVVDSAEGEDTAPAGPQDTAPPTPPEDRPPLWFGGGDPPANVFILSIDTLRRDHLGRWGGDGDTPYLDSLIEEGVALDDHVQCSNWTFASMSCTTLGRPGRDLGWVPQISSAGRALMPQAGTLPGWLRDEAGFYTLVNSINGWFSDEWDTVQGYDKRLSKGPQAEDAILAAADSLEAAIADGDVGDHWLMHVHVTEPHAAYKPPEEYLDDLAALDPIEWDLSVSDYHYDATAEWPSLSPDEQALLLAHLQVRYRAEVRYLDDQLSRSFAELDSRGLLEDTLVVIYNDHGEAFWEHGNQSHAHTLHAQENDGILVFWGKTLTPGVWSEPTHATDLAATLLGVHGVPVPAEVTGQSLGEAAEDRSRFQFSVARQGVVQSVIQGPHKLHYSWRDGRLELYDRVADPDEATDLASTLPDVVETLWLLLRPEVEALDPLLTEAPIWPAIDE